MIETNVNKLIDFAIEQEYEAYNFYKAASEKVANPGVKKIFHELAQEEQGHASLLEMYKKNEIIADIFKCQTIDYKITETQDMPSLSILMKPSEAIVIAMKRELQSADLYRVLASNTIRDKEKEALLNLANMEMGHKHRLENIFVEIGYPEVF